jgi:ELWxxDGT repeat protein
VFFIANDDHGVELWMSDGQPGGTRLVADLGRFAAGGLFMDQRFQALGGRLLFTACSAAGSQLWQSGGTAETTTPLSLAPPSPPFPLCDFASNPRGLTVAGDLAYFGLELSRSQLWRTDGSPAGTILVTEFPEDASLSGGTLTPLGNRVLFAVDVQDGFELWTSDGTPAGTGKFFDLPCCSRAGFFAAVGSEVYFSVGLIDSELWRTDGTAAGTRRVSAEEAFWNHARHFIRFGSAVLFFASTDTDLSSPRLQLWKTDGTPAGTVPVSPNLFGSLGHEASPLLELQGALYFLVTNSTTASNGLWRTDGTEAGTRLVRELSNSFPGTPLVPFAGRFFFAAGDAAHGLELWQSDGTTAGTSLLRDVFPGVESSRPSALTVAGGRLFFVARDRFHGIELWQTDGTEAGTRLVQDLAPAGASSEPRTLTLAGDRLFFSADDGVSGRELWALPLSGNAGCQASSSRLCLNGGRFQVEVTWKAANGLTGAGRAAALTGDTGTFWFFDPANVELVVKVLDGRPLNGHFWVFYGALSNVEYTLTVTDTQTGVSRRYLNLSGRMASVGDTRAFGPLGAFASTPAPDGTALVAERSDPAATAPCQPGPRRLCLNQGRFAVEATWKDFQDHTGDGTAVGLTGDTGYFWFFDPANAEVVLKVLDGRSLNGKFWVFYGALSNVEYSLHVTDTQTGIVRTYTNPRGRFASVADTGAF